MATRYRRNVSQDTPRHEIVVGAFAKTMGGWLVKVDEAWVDEAGRLRCKGPVVSRPLCADNLAGEKHPVMEWVAR